MPGPQHTRTRADQRARWPVRAAVGRADHQHARRRRVPGRLHLAARGPVAAARLARAAARRPRSRRAGHPRARRLEHHRLPRRSTVLGADAGRAPLLLGMAPALHQPPPVPALALLVIAYGVLTALFRPALVAYLPELVQSDRLASANSLLAVSMQTSMVAGLRGRPAARPCHAHLRAGPRHPGRGHGWPCVRLRPAARRTAMDHRVATQHPGCLAASAPSTTSARSCSCRPSFAFGALLVESAGAELVLLTAGAIGILVAAIGLAVPGLHRWRRFGSDDDVIQPAAGSRHGAPQR